MKKQKISINYQDGNAHPTNGKNMTNSGHVISQMSRYTDIEIEIDQYLKDEGTMQLRKTLKSISANYIHEENKTVSPKIRPMFQRTTYIYAIAVTIVILIGLFGIIRLIVNSSENKYQGIFVQYYKPYQSDFAVRSDQIIVNNLNLAFQSYEDRDYKRAIELFTKVVEADESLLIAYFYKGISCMEINDFKTAVGSFSKVLKNDANPYYPQAQWYISLTFLKLSNPSLARQHLEWLLSNDRFYGSKAKEILLKLK